MPMVNNNGRRIRASARLSANELRSHGVCRGRQEIEAPCKKRKISSKTQQDRLAIIMTEFSEAVNELYQLQEYRSLVDWKPSDFSKSCNKLVPMAFSEFCENGDYKLKWSQEIENDKELKSLPFRFQKKRLAEREELLDAHFPFRKQVYEKHCQMEREKFLIQTDIPKQQGKKIVKPKAKPVKRLGLQWSSKDDDEEKKQDKEKEEKKQNEDEEKEDEEKEDKDEEKEDKDEEKEDKAKEDKDVDLNTLGTNETLDESGNKSRNAIDHKIGGSFNKRIKRISYSVPSLLITHPTHIPGFKPESQEEMQNPGLIDSRQAESEVVKFSPLPIQITWTKDGLDVASAVAKKLDEFLNNNFKTPIIDETTFLEYGYSKIEYDKINRQQQAMFRKIYQKINVENTLEFNENKIERRKIILPPTSNVKLSDPFRDTTSVFPKLQGSANNMTHQDHLLAQGMTFSRIHQQMRRQHINRSRKVALIVDQHFKKKKGEKDRLNRERDMNLKKMSRIMMQAIKKRWNEAFKVYQIIQNEKEEELKKIKGREHLSQMLEHSTQLLEAQLTSSKEATAESENIASDSEQSRSYDSADFSSEDEEEEEEEEEEEKEKEKKLHTAAAADAVTSDDEQHTEQTRNSLGFSKTDEDDINLSVEELRRKYANIESSVDPTSEMSRDDDDNDDDNDGDDDDDDDDDDDEEDDDGNDGNDGNDDDENDDASSGKEEEKKENHSPEVLNGEESITNEISNGFSKIHKEMEDSNKDSSDHETSNDETSTNSDTSIQQNGGLASLFTELDDENSESDQDVKMESSSADSDDESIFSDEEDAQLNGRTRENGAHETNSDDEEEAVEIVNGAKVRDVPVPSLLRGTLRPYQKQGLNWLASLYNNNTNGILADEMGLGKTIQTISLLSYLACEHHIWGPHLIIVPTSVMLNWDMEFKKFAPGFKVMTYYGSPQQRAQKRKGWFKPDAFHVCITSYQLVVQDQQAFKRRRWRYMILDEAHNIKNFRSTRWRALLNFNTENRLLLTGTPLQNSLMELWSLLYFLMPSSKTNLAMPDGFANLEDFQQWFGKPVDKILEQATLSTNSDLIDENEKTTQKMDKETRNTVSRLHQVLRPYILRRLKKDVEKQMPGKYEHIVYCRLSKRQRFLYDDFMSRAKTKETLASGNFLSIINCLMQLRKVCNHPDLFEVRPIVTSFSMPKAVSCNYQSTSQRIRSMFNNKEEFVDFNVLNLDITMNENLNHFVSESTARLQSSNQLQKQIDQLAQSLVDKNKSITDYVDYYQNLMLEEQIETKSKLEQVRYINSFRCNKKPLYGNSLIGMLTLKKRNYNEDPFEKYCMSINKRVESIFDEIEQFSIVTPPVVALDMKDQLIPKSTQYLIQKEVESQKITNPFHMSQVKLSIAFPDKTLLQFDCGKLQRLAVLLRDLTAEGHRALIFTQMTKVLDILEQFLNIHGYRYMRLDGATKIEDRQLLTEKFNRDSKIPVFILSTRSGGLGINLTGADTVIFYDSDWNPAMDKQCQDRCHRIGQVRDVHIYRFVSEYTIESNILRKANQKRHLDNVVIQEGEFTTDYFGKFSVRDLVNDPNIPEATEGITDRTIDFSGDAKMGSALAQAEDEEDRVAAGAALKEVAVDDEDFSEENNKDSSKKFVPNNDDLTNDGDVDFDYDKGIGHIDEYMLRFIADGYY
ncbi:SWR1 [Candida oxycetoniae]|uniref:Helicase SWR1 n=1 Tax=Candida oxycetoniae TaxID=497107 RepID=A0AAI9SVI2_9ASCO|nr:SWR1 [Candida oxycetoniae]KAI3403455.2 SWR1 [Candida oxycetoniae]